jgi:hypothetical protein
MDPAFGSADESACSSPSIAVLVRAILILLGAICVNGYSRWPAFSK